MAKILLSFSSHYSCDGVFKIGAFYEGLIKSFCEAGNDVMVMNSADFLKVSWNGDSNHCAKYINIDRICEEVKVFRSDMVIAFNNSIPDCIKKICDCPIIVWAADDIKYFNDKTNLIRDSYGHYLFCAQENSLARAFDLGWYRKNIFKIDNATSVVAEKLDKKYPISFIGTNFRSDKMIGEFIRHEGGVKARQLMDYLSGSFFKNVNKQELCNKLKIDDEDIDLDKLIEVFSSVSTIHNRVTILNNLTDLGLNIWGTTNWVDTSDYLPYLAMCYNKDKVYSLKHNQDIYNSSVLSISIAHAQAVEGFPWRIMDVMASNACLVTDYHKHLDDLTKGYVKLPTYDNPYDARKLCEKLLKDEKWREDVILGSQKCVEDKCRWKHRFKEIEEIVGVKITNNGIGEVSDSGFSVPVYLDREEYYSSYYKYIKNVTVKMMDILPYPLLKIGYKLVKILHIPIDVVVASEIRDKALNRKKQSMWSKLMNKILARR